jgi:hypothetical protein
LQLLSLAVIPEGNLRSCSCCRSCCCLFFFVVIPEGNLRLELLLPVLFVVIPEGNLRLELLLPVLLLSFRSEAEESASKYPPKFLVFLSHETPAKSTPNSP